MLSYLVITYWERADLFALLCVVHSCVFVTFPNCVPGQVWYWIVSIPDLCLPLYFPLQIDLGSNGLPSQVTFILLTLECWKKTGLVSKVPLNKRLDLLLIQQNMLWNTTDLQF